MSPTALCSSTSASHCPVPTGSQQGKGPVVGNCKIQPPEASNMVEPDRVGTEGQTKIFSSESGVQTLSFSKQSLMMAYYGFWEQRRDEVGKASILERQQTTDSQD